MATEEAIMAETTPEHSRRLDQEQDALLVALKGVLHDVTDEEAGYVLEGLHKQGMRIEPYTAAKAVYDLLGEERP